LEMTTLSMLPARLEYGCGHVALVSLGHTKGESARHRADRVQREKAAARQRSCDFCTQQAPLAPPLEAVAQALQVAESAPLQTLAYTNSHAPAELADPLSTTLAQLVSTDGTATTDGAPTAEPTDQTEPSRTDKAVRRRRLDEQQTNEVARLYAATDTPVSQIARQFGVGQMSVYRIAQRHGLARRGTAEPTRAEPSVHESVPASIPRTEAPAKQRTTAARIQSGSARTGARARSRASARRPFRVRFVAERIIAAESIYMAIQQADALGATEITSIVRLR
jgi:transposase-like protein